MAFKDEDRFYKIDGESYPSVTTIIKCLDKPALVPWASKMQREADALTAATAESPRAAAQLILASPNAAYAKSAKAADIGTEAHGAVEAYLKGEKIPLLTEAAQSCFDSWVKWWKQSKFQAVGIETVVHSVTHGYAGRIDLLAEWKSPKGQVLRYVLDWKSGKDIYPEAHLQNIAYRGALAEMGMATHGGAMVLLSKDGGKVKVVPARPEITLEDFLKVLGAWEVKRKLDNRPTGERA